MVIPQALTAARVTARLRTLDAPRAYGAGLQAVLPGLRAVTALRCPGSDLPVAALRRLGHLAGNLVELDARYIGPVHPACSFICPCGHLPQPAAARARHHEVRQS